MKKLMKLIMLSCKNASELIAKKSVVNLSLKETIQLHIHTSMCDVCKIYQKQSKIVDELLFKYIHTADETSVPQVINNDLKQKIISKL